MSILSEQKSGMNIYSEGYGFNPSWLMVVRGAEHGVPTRGLARMSVREPSASSVHQNYLFTATMD